MSSCAASSSMQVAAWLPQGPLLRPVASPAAPHRRPGCGRCCNSRHHRSSTSRWISLFRRSRPPTQSQRHQSSFVDLSALSGAADLHPHAHAAPGHGTMIRSAHLRQNGSLLLPHAPARHGDRLSPAQLSAPLLLATPLPLAPRPAASGIGGSAQSCFTCLRGGASSACNTMRSE